MPLLRVRFTAPVRPHAVRPFRLSLRIPFFPSNPLKDSQAVPSRRAPCTYMFQSASLSGPAVAVSV